VLLAASAFVRQQVEILTATIASLRGLKGSAARWCLDVVEPLLLLAKLTDVLKTTRIPVISVEGLCWLVLAALDADLVRDDLALGLLSCVILGSPASPPAFAAAVLDARGLPLALTDVEFVYRLREMALRACSLKVGAA